METETNALADPASTEWISDFLDTYTPKYLTRTQWGEARQGLEPLLGRCGFTTLTQLRTTLASVTRFLADVIADGEVCDESVLVNEHRISVWSHRWVAAGQNQGTLANHLGRLNRLLRARRAPVEPPRTYDRARPTDTAVTTVRRFLRCLAGSDPAACRAAVAVAGAGILIKDFAGLELRHSYDGAVFDRDGVQTPVVAELAAVVAALPGGAVRRDDWNRARAVAANANVAPFTQSSLRLAWTAAVIREADSPATAIRATGASWQRIDTAVGGIEVIAESHITRSQLREVNAPSKRAGTDSPEPTGEGNSTMTRISKSEARRRAAEARKRQHSTVPLPKAHAEHLASYRPAKIAADTWAVVKDVHDQVMGQCGAMGLESFRKRGREVTAFLAARHEEGLSITIADAFTYEAIDADYVRRTKNLSERSANDRRSRLRKVAEVVNPNLATLPRAASLGHVSIKPPYTPSEVATIKRVAERQRLPKARRALCAVVGLCGGAGLDSVDLRPLRTTHIYDEHESGIRVEVPGKRARTVWVRKDFEELVRIGLTEVRPGHLILGTKENRRNIVGRVVERSELLGDIPHIEAARLRSTWLAALMTTNIPLATLMSAAGLKSCRTLIDLLPHLPATDIDIAAALRGTAEVR